MKTLGNFGTTKQIIRHSNIIGRHDFAILDMGMMHVHPELFGGCVFLMSHKARGMGLARDYSVYIAYDDGSIEMVGKYTRHKDEALARAEKIANHLVNIGSLSLIGLACKPMASAQ